MSKSSLKNFLRSILFIALVVLLVNSAYARRGCCSWHGGVASCDSSVGRLICNDGTYSPSCGCEINEPIRRTDLSQNIMDNDPDNRPTSNSRVNKNKGINYDEFRQ